MFPTVNQDMLKTAYDALVIATTNAQGAGLEYERQKEDIETMTLRAIVSGEIQGKNEGERKAAALAMFQVGYSNLSKLELEAKQAQFALELCKIKLNFIRDSIRLDELAAQSIEITAKPVNVTVSGSGNDIREAMKKELRKA